MSRRAGDGPRIEGGFDNRDSEVKLALRELVIGGSDSIQRLAERLFPNIPGAERALAAWLIQTHGNSVSMPAPGTVVDLPSDLNEILDVGSLASQEVHEMAIKAIEGKGTFSRLSEIRNQAQAESKKNVDRRADGMAPPSAKMGAVTGRKAQKILRPGAASKVAPADRELLPEEQTLTRQRAAHMSAMVELLANTPEIKTRGDRLKSAIVDALVEEGVNVVSGAMLEKLAGKLVGKLNEAAMPGSVRWAGELADAEAEYARQLVALNKEVPPAEMARMYELVLEAAAESGLAEGLINGTDGAGVATALIAALREAAGRTGTDVFSVSSIASAHATLSETLSTDDAAHLEAILSENIDGYVMMVGKHSTWWRSEAGKLLLAPGVSLQTLGREQSSVFKMRVAQMIAKTRPDVGKEKAQQIASDLADGLARFAGGVITARVRSTALHRLERHIGAYEDVQKGDQLETLAQQLATASPTKRGEACIALGLPVEMEFTAESLRSFVAIRLEVMRDTVGKLEGNTQGAQEIFEAAPWAAASVFKELGIRFNDDGEIAVPEHQESLLETGVRKHKAFGSMLKAIYNSIAALATAPFSGAFEVQARSLQFLMGVGTTLAPTVFELGALELGDS